MTGLGSKRAAWDPEGSIPDVRRVDVSLHPEAILDRMNTEATLEGGKIPDKEWELTRRFTH